MKESKRRSMILIIITIAVFLIAIIGATYAFFSTSRDVNNVINANIGTAASMYSFSATSNGNIEMNIAFNEMSQANVSTNVLKTDNATIDVSLASPMDNMLTTCTYDIVWVWDSDDKYLTPDLDLPYLSDGIIEDFFGSKEAYEDSKQWYIETYGKETWDKFIEELISYNGGKDREYYNNEFSIMVNNQNETDLSRLSIDTDGKTVTLQKNASITSKSTTPTKQTYIVTSLIYNLPVDQQNLFGKSFKAHITVDNLDCTMMDISNKSTLATYIKEDVYNNDDNQVNIENALEGLYYHSSNLANGAEDNSYRYAGGYSFPKASEGYDSFDNIIDDYEEDWYNQYECKGGCYMLTYDETRTKYSKRDVLNKAMEDGYIEEINNYVCFQGDDCTDEDNLYRIIGVIDNKVKLIKYTDINPYKTLLWNSDENNTWEGSTLETYLNSNEELLTYTCYNEVFGYFTTCQKVGYLYSLGSKINLIDTTSWYVGGMELASIQSPNTVKNTYDIEIGGQAIERKIGLMYASDYGYAALPENWTTDLYDYESSLGRDWIATSFFYYPSVAWTISPESDSDEFVFSITYETDSSAGYVSETPVVFNSGLVYPVFNLLSDVKIINADAEGVGSATVPMIIA